MKTIIVVGGLALAGGAFFVPWSSEKSEGAETSARELYTVRRDDLKVTITENGTMVAKQSQKLVAKVRGEAKLQFLIEEGKEVPEGEVVVRLDGTQVKSQVEQTQIEILQTEANLKTAKTELEIHQVESAATMTKAQNALDRAKKEIEKYVDGESPQLRRKLEVELKDAETGYNKAKKELDDCKKLLEQNYVKKSDLERAQIDFDRATVQKESAQVGLLMFDKYTFPMALKELQTKLDDAERELKTSEKRGESTLAQKTVNVQQVEKRLKVQQDQLKERQKDLENMEIKAPCPGIVVWGDPHEYWYRERLKVGGQVWGGQTLMTIPDLRVMQVKLQIHEADISKLKVGLRATVTTDSFPGVQLEGEVTKIATVAAGNENWGGSSEVKKFDVEITLKEGVLSEGTAKEATAKAGTPTEGTPKEATAKEATANEGTPTEGTAKPDTSKEATAKAVIPTEGTPKEAAANEGTPTEGTAKPDTSKEATAKAVTPTEGTAKEATAKADTSKEGTPTEGTKKGSQRMRPGISAKAEIHIETRPQILFVPLQTVFAEDGVHYCHVQVPGKTPEKRKVVIGTNNDTYLEILEGLAEGDRVLLYNPMLPESGEAPKKEPKPDQPPPPSGPKQGPPGPAPGAAKGS